MQSSNFLGEIRLKRDVENLMRIGAKGFDLLPRTEPCELKVRFHPLVRVNTNSDENIRVPCNFLIIVDKYYPHDRPIVKCLDPGYTCIHIGSDGVLLHRDLQEDWSPICALGDIVKSIQSVRQFVYKLQVQYEGENTFAQAQFDTTIIDATSVRERVTFEAEAFENEQGSMMIDDHDDDLESEMMIYNEGDEQNDSQRSITSMAENIDDELCG